MNTVGGTATYNVSAPGATAIAVFNGSTKLATITGANGQFSVATGGTYNLYAVTGPTTGDGIGTASVSPVAPIVDLTAPTTTSDAKPTYVGVASIMLTATDLGSGVQNTYFILDGGAQTAGTAISTSALGSHAVEFWSVDVAGNIETHKFASFTVTAPQPVDITAPVTTSDAVATYVSSAVLKLTATDAGSGVAATYFTLDGGVQTAGTVIATSALGSHTVEFWSVDVAGNAEAHNSATFTVTAPTQPGGTVPTTLSIRVRERDRDGDREHWSEYAHDREESHFARTVSLSGRLTPGAEDLSVSLYVMEPESTTWSLVSVLATNGSEESDGSSWRYSFAPSAPGTYSFQVRFDGTDTLAASTSRIVSAEVH